MLQWRAWPNGHRMPHHTLGTCAFLTAGPLISRACYHASDIFYTDRLAPPDGSQRRSDLRSNASTWDDNFFRFARDLCLSQGRRFRHSSSDSLVLVIQGTLQFS